MGLRKILALVFLTCSAMWAQQGTITGTVADASGALIADATVTAHHVPTGTNIAGQSTATGNFTLANLPVGAYTVSVEKTSFKTFKRENITLLASQPLRLDVVMEVGASTESVTVTAEASMMKTDSGALVHNIRPQEIQTLPLMVTYFPGAPTLAMARDPFATVQTLPGVVFTSNTDIRVNGLGGTNVQYRLDGEVLGNIGAPGITTRTQPSADAIQEIAVQTSNFAAEFGSVGGAVFNVTIKSGTNQYHGSVYDYMVNEALNAGAPGISVSTGAPRKNRIRRHEYGFNIGGPIKIPGVYDGANKSFFFFNWNQLRDTQVVRVFTAPTVPIQAYRDGDFSGLPGFLNNANLTVGSGVACGQPGANPTTCLRDYKDPFGNTVRSGLLFDPASLQKVTCNTTLSQDCGTNNSIVDYRTPLLNNKLTANMLDPVAIAIQNKYIPLPEGPQASSRINNYYVPYNTRRLTRLPSLKFDHNLTSSARISFTYQLTKTTQDGSDGLPLNAINTNLRTVEASPNYRVNYDMTLTPTLQLHIGAGWSQFDFSNPTYVTNFNPLEDIGLAGARLNRNFPAFASSVIAGTAALGGMQAMGAAGQSVNPERRPSGSVSLTWIRNNHTIKYGADWRFDMLPLLNFSNTAGNIGGFNSTNIAGSATATGQAGGTITGQPALNGVTLTGTSTNGFPYANFLLGSVRSLTLGAVSASRTSKHQWGMYLQDSWRATRNLTVDLGLRWDLGTYTKEDRGRNSTLSLLEPNPSASGRLGARIYEGTCNCSFAANYPYAIGPRLGFAYTLNPRTVFRGGFGVSYGSTGTFGGSTASNAVMGAPPFGLDGFKLREGYPVNVNPAWPTFDPAFGHTIGTTATAPTMLDRNAGRPSRTYQWNLSLQREITRNLTIEASYVGNRGVWQNAGGKSAFNAISEADLARYGFKVGNQTDRALLNNTNWNNLSVAQRADLDARGVRLPYPNFPVSGTFASTVIQSLRTYPQYNGTFNPSNAPLGLSWYDSLQITVNKRYSHGLLVNANYTYSRNFSANSYADIFNKSYANKDIVGANPPQQLRISFEYQTPRPSPAMPIIGNRFISQALGGWGVSMALFFQTAPYLSRPATQTAQPISNWLGRGPGAAQLKKNADGSYMNPWAKTWTDNDGKLHTNEPLDINCDCFDPEKTLVLDPTVWESIPDGQWATQTQILPQFRGVRRPTEAGNISRNFKFGKDGRFTLQVRAEFQNMFNRLLLPQSPGTCFFGVCDLGNFNNTPVPTADGRYTAGFGTFGNLRGGAGAFGPSRSGQFIGRLSF
jgi:hypothetical protein